MQAVSSDIKIPNSISFSLNLLLDKILGEAISRQGTNIVNAQLSAGATCQGIFQHLDSDSTKHKLFAGFNGVIYETKNTWIIETEKGKKIIKNETKIKEYRN